MNLKDLENQAPPKTLYHYTSQFGLIGILMHHEIWASKIYYMNDSKEFSLALDLAQSDLKQRMEAENSEKERRRLEVLLHEIDTITQINICVCSLSELGDSLSQWRGYTGGGAGFSVGFSTERLLQLTREAEFSLYPCIYDPETQKALIGELIEESLATDFNTIPGYIDPNRPRTLIVLPMGGDFAKRLARLAPLLKDPSFADEKEWRLVSNPLNTEKLDHRPGKSMITPYYRLPIGSEKEFNSLDEIVVGPTPHLDLSKASVSTLLGTARVTKPPEIKITKVPFRDW